MFWRRLPFSLTTLLLVCGILLSATLDHGVASRTNLPVRLAPLDAPGFSITSGRGRLLLEGVTVSVAHESALAQLADEHFENSQRQVDFKPGVILADNWESTTNRLLYAIAVTDSAQAILQNQSLEIRGVTADAKTFASRLEFLRETLPADTAVRTNIIAVDLIESPEPLCKRSFANLHFEPISFRQSSTEIRTSSFAVLDRITEFAHDCQSTKIAITGHTDSTGSETWNRQLSRARAQAIANHIAASGVDPSRLIIAGVGSSKPIADNDSVRGRGLNRRIDIELR
ncbi:MAG: OmpA family protein [Gammaproteobacteria bacterium]|nr:OmpA family protein [Gammaproteobacteria bacterium]MDH3432479.1 OmpA family protein [Gammaproteobacteria bacterium]